MAKKQQEWMKDLIGELTLSLVKFIFISFLENPTVVRVGEFKSRKMAAGLLLEYIYFIDYPCKSLYSLETEFKNRNIGNFSYKHSRPSSFCSKTI